MEEQAYGPLKDTIEEECERKTADKNTETVLVNRRAINNVHYVSWPGLTSAIVKKHFSESEETLKGHARKTRSGLRSTETASPTVEDVTPSGKKTLKLKRATAKGQQQSKRRFLSGLMTSKMTCRERCTQIR